MVKKPLLLGFAGLLFVYSVNQSTIQKIDTMQDQSVQKVLSASNAQTLVVFDIDETLTFYPDYLMYYPSQWTSLLLTAGLANKDDAASLQQTLEAIDARKGAGYAEALVDSSVRLKDHEQLIEPDVLPGLVGAMQARATKVIALTAVSAGAFGVIPCMRTSRFESLLKLGINFSKAFQQEEIVFDKLKPCGSDYPMLYKGILFANENNSKGSVLGALLNHISWRPSKVVFFDDREGHLKSVEQEMEKRGIAFQGYWYSGAQKLPHPTFDGEVGRFQLSHLLEHDEYMLYKHAAEALAK